MGLTRNLLESHTHYLKQERRYSNWKVFSIQHGILYYKGFKRNTRHNDDRPDYENSLGEAGLSPTILPSIVELWKSQNEKKNTEKGK